MAGPVLTQPTDNARAVLTQIDELVADLVKASMAGGSLELAFDLTIDEAKLEEAYKLLYDMDDAIRTEVEDSTQEALDFGR